MAIRSVSKSETFAGLPPEWPQDLMPTIQANLVSSGTKLVVLDDDPTGTQTVHHVPVLSRWSVGALAAEIAAPGPTFYLLTNSRALQSEKAAALNYEIGANLSKAANQAGRRISVISRSDSTLRGHFPGEVKALIRGLGQKFDAVLIVPYFREGGRFTIEDVHYVAAGEDLVPAGETEFARDATFGYCSSNLRDWVREKMGEAELTENVASISLHSLRTQGPESVARQLCTFENERVCVVNAAADRDLEVLSVAIQKSEAKGRRFLFRTAASFVRVHAGILPQALLDAESLPLSGSNGGLVVVGSHIPRSTAQLNYLRRSRRMVEIELSVNRLLEAQDGSPWVDQYLQEITIALDSGQDVLVFTSRLLVEGNDGRESLEISRRVSAGLVQLVQSLTARPRYLIAKGGITSSDIATHGLGVERAQVLGQVLPGVPVWQLGPESAFPGLTYIVFPGNVGEEDALLEIINRLCPTI